MCHSWMFSCLSAVQLFVVFDFFFFFKQKTAYEMRIGDWSSDVCSSDQRLALPRDGDIPRQEGHALGHAIAAPQIAPVGHREAQIADREIGRASCRERVCQYV